MATPMTDDIYPSGDRYHLHAYVCGGACVRRVVDPITPTCTFRQVFTSRPDGCRYAVVSQWDAPEGKYRYLVFDLFKAEARNNPVNPGKVIWVETPKPRLTHDDLDAAIMGTVMLYNDSTE